MGTSVCRLKDLRNLMGYNCISRRSQSNRNTLSLAGNFFVQMCLAQTMIFHINYSIVLCVIHQTTGNILLRGLLINVAVSLHTNVLLPRLSIFDDFNQRIDASEEIVLVSLAFIEHVQSDLVSLEGFIVFYESCIMGHQGAVVGHQGGDVGHHSGVVFL